MVNISAFADHMLSVPTAQSCRCRGKAAEDHTQTSGHGCVSGGGNAVYENRWQADLAREPEFAKGTQWQTQL